MMKNYIYLLVTTSAIVNCLEHDKLQSAISTEMQNIRIAIQESNLKNLQTCIHLIDIHNDFSFLSQRSEIASFASTFMQNKPALLQLAKDTLTLREKNEKNAGKFGWFALRALMYPAVLVKTVIDVGYTINGEYNTSHGVSITNLYVDALLLISAGYNLYRFLGPENIPNKTVNAKIIKSFLEDTTFKIEASLTETNDNTIEIDIE